MTSRAPDNDPGDPITMTILGVTKADQDGLIRARLDELSFGTIKRIDVKPVISPDGQVLCKSYVVRYQRWDPLDQGADVRQKLQTKGKTKIYDTDGQYLWTVSYVRRIKTSVAADKIRLADPYSRKIETRRPTVA
jgi:hypothetical protein